MPTTVSSRRYAQAAFQIAQQKERLEEWRSDLRKIAKLAQDTEFVSLLENPKLPFELKAKLAQEALGKVNPLALNLAYLLITKGRLSSASQIADEYDRLLDDYRSEYPKRFSHHFRPFRTVSNRKTWFSILGVFSDISDK